MGSPESTQQPQKSLGNSKALVGGGESQGGGSGLSSEEGNSRSKTCQGPRVGSVQVWRPPGASPALPSTHARLGAQHFIRGSQKG